MTESDAKPQAIQIRSAEFEDLKISLRLAWIDFKKHPFLSGLFGLIYVLVGNILILGLFQFQHVWAVLPVAVGFPLIAPFAAAGIYEISRRHESDLPITFKAILMVVWQQRARELGWMAFTVLFIFWIWVYQVRLLLALLLSQLSFSSLDSLLDVIFFTSQGWMFLSFGTVIGAALSTILFSLTVISMPMLLDREIDFITAMIVSVQTVLKSPIVMLCWGALIACVLIVSMVPAFLGILIALPIFGHATWHLYRQLITAS